MAVKQLVKFNKTCWSEKNQLFFIFSKHKPKLFSIVCTKHFFKILVTWTFPSGLAKKQSSCIYKYWEGVRLKVYPFFFLKVWDCPGQHKILDILIPPWPILRRKKIALTKDLFYLCFVLRIPVCPTEVSSLLMLSVCKEIFSQWEADAGRARDARAVDFKQGTCKDGNLPRDRLSKWEYLFSAKKHPLGSEHPLPIQKMHEWNAVSIIRAPCCQCTLSSPGNRPPPPMCAKTYVLKYVNIS